MGNTIAKAVEQGNELVGLFEDDFVQLIRVAEAMHKSLRPPVITVQLLTNLFLTGFGKRVGKRSTYP